MATIHSETIFISFTCMVFLFNSEGKCLYSYFPSQYSSLGYKVNMAKKPVLVSSLRKALGFYVTFFTLWSHKTWKPSLLGVVKHTQFPFLLNFDLIALKQPAKSLQICGVLNMFMLPSILNLHHKSLFWWTLYQSAFLLLGHNIRHLQFKGGDVYFNSQFQKIQSIVIWLQRTNSLVGRA